MAAPKTIVVTTLSGMGPIIKSLPVAVNLRREMSPRPSPAGSSSSGSDMDESGEVGQQPGRKRQRLDHLSMEEKIMRRKMKNRVAAQTARDRKKARMEELESVVQDMEEKYAALEVQNISLIVENQKLQEQNEELRLMLEERLALDAAVEEVKVVVVKEEVQSSPPQLTHPTPPSSPPSSPATHPARACESVESAALVSDPLQKGQDRQVQLEVAATTLMMLLSLSSLFWTWTSVMTTASRSLSSSHSRCLSMIPSLERAVNKLRHQWWGPHQKGWNPPNN